MSTTGSTLRAARHVLNHFGLADPDHPHYATGDGRLTLVAAVYRASTGTTPGAFLTNPDDARHLMQTNPTVFACIRWLSAVLPTEPGTDQTTGQPDFINHIDNWCADTNRLTGRRPTTGDVIDLLERAAQAADALTDTAHPPIPTQRAAA
jgi:hypothetical protein